MNAPFRPLTAAQVTSGAVLDRCLRTAHEIEGLLNSTIGTIDHEAKHAVITDAQRAEALTVAGYLAAHAETLRALAGSIKPTVPWTPGDLGLVISEAVANHNDVDGVAWKGVARDVAAALNIPLNQKDAA